MKATVYLKRRVQIDTCCPRCALHYEIGRPGEVARVTVADGATGEVTNATQAIYIEGSDAEGCHPDMGSTPREPGVGYDRTFDRCLPSLVAFKTETDAREFQKRYGGRVLDYAQALQNVKGH
jgi:hypothetical protein